MIARSSAQSDKKAAEQNEPAKLRKWQAVRNEMATPAA